MVNVPWKLNFAHACSCPYVTREIIRIWEGIIWLIYTTYSLTYSSIWAHQTVSKYAMLLDLYWLTYFLYQGIISTLTTNTVGPLVMAKYFAPLLQKGGGGFGQQPTEKAKQHSGIIVNITAKVGSIGDNGGYCVADGSETLFFHSLNVCPHPLRSWWLVQLQNV